MYNDKINYKYKIVGYILVLIFHNKSILKASLYVIHKIAYRVLWIRSQTCLFLPPFRPHIYWSYKYHTFGRKISVRNTYMIEQWQWTEETPGPWPSYSPFCFLQTWLLCRRLGTGPLRSDFYLPFENHHNPILLRSRFPNHPWRKGKKTFKF